MKTYSNYTFFYTGPFSQWDHSEFRALGRDFTRAEQYMMYRKATLFGDQEVAEKIMQADHPKVQKALGRQVKGFNDEVWRAKARDFVLEGNYAKFTQNPGHLTALFETAGTLLVEASPYDRIWGIGLGMGDSNLPDRNLWKGTNWLGEVLTVLRDGLLEGSFLPPMGLYEWS